MPSDKMLSKGVSSAQHTAFMQAAEKAGLDKSAALDEALRLFCEKHNVAYPYANSHGGDRKSKDGSQMVNMKIVEKQIEEVQGRYGKRALDEWARTRGISPFYTIQNPQVLEEMQQSYAFKKAEYIRQMDNIRALAEKVLETWAADLAVPLIYNDPNPKHPEHGAFARARIDLDKAIAQFEREILVSKIGNTGIAHFPYQMQGFRNAKQMLSEATEYDKRRGWIENSAYWEDVYSRS